MKFECSDHANFSGLVQSLEVNYSEETEESDNSTVSECSTEEEYETSASLVSTISTGTSSSGNIHLLLQCLYHFLFVTTCF